TGTGRSTSGSPRTICRSSWRVGPIGTRSIPQGSIWRRCEATGGGDRTSRSRPRTSRRSITITSTPRPGGSDTMSRSTGTPRRPNSMRTGTSNDRQPTGGGGIPAFRGQVGSPWESDGETRIEGTMGKVYEQLDEALMHFIDRQHVFFVGTAPDSPGG